MVISLSHLCHISGSIVVREVSVAAFQTAIAVDRPARLDWGLARE